MRHAQRRVVTVAVDSLVFREPIKIGDLIILNAEVTYTGRTSIEAEVQVIAENPVTGERTHTNTAYLVYVALDDEGRPTPVPALIAETDEDKQRMEQAKKRQAHRIAQK
jgi:acyl-CoA hydrolase